MTQFTESTVESATLTWFESLGYATLHGPAIAPGEPAAERASYCDVVLEGRFRAALKAVNPHLPAEALEDAARQVLRPPGPSLVESNHRFHRMLADGVNVEYRGADGRVVGDKAWLFDFERPERNDWLAVNQFTVVEGQHNRRPDLVVVVNGLPLAVIELKNPADENATLRSAFNQIQTYKAEIPSVFTPINRYLIFDAGY